MNNTDIKKPIIILGAARSGTSMLAGKVMANHPDIAYWNEPSYIWNYGNAYKRDDILTKNEASSPIITYIRKKFEEYLVSAQRSYFMEKTPSNCLRVPFILEVFPQARFVHLIRDGRDVAISAAEEWIGRGEQALDSKELRSLPKHRKLLGILKSETNFDKRINNLRCLIEIPAYMPRAFSTLMRQVFHPTYLLWGPRIPQLKKIRKKYSLLETCAIQWKVCVESVLQSCKDLPQEQYIEIKYEDLLETPQKEMLRVWKFLNIDVFNVSNQKLLGEKIKYREKKWPNLLTTEKLILVEEQIKETLVRLDYPLSSEQ